MSEDEPEDESEDETASITIELDGPREMMYVELCQLFGAETMNRALNEKFVEILTKMYNKREELTDQQE